MWTTPPSEARVSTTRTGAMNRNAPNGPGGMGVEGTAVGVAEAAMVAVGVAAPLGGAPSASLPEPKALSLPAAPRSVARPSRKERISAGPYEGLACLTSAAAPATCGADAEVPPNPDVPQALKDP